MAYHLNQLIPMKPTEPKAPQLGPLERRLLALLCQRTGATVRELLSCGQIQAAYTTVMTTLDRLYKKGFLERTHDAEGKAFRYRLKNGEREFYNLVLGPDLKSVLASAVDPSIQSRPASPCRPGERLLIAIVSIAMLASIYMPLLRQVHEATELFVR